MSLTDIVLVLKPVSVVGLVLVIGSLIKITPLQINIWSWLARKIGNALNHDMIDKITTIEKRLVEIEKKLDDHIKENEVDQVLRTRKSILNFGREIVTGIRHTREEYLECLACIDGYEAYCLLHPEFPNNRATLAILMIKDNYQERLEKADFLAEEYRVKKEVKK